MEGENLSLCNPPSPSPLVKPTTKRGTHRSLRRILGWREGREWRGSGEGVKGGKESRKRVAGLDRERKGTGGCEQEDWGQQGCLKCFEAQPSRSTPG